MDADSLAFAVPGEGLVVAENPEALWAYLATYLAGLSDAESKTFLDTCAAHLCGESAALLSLGRNSLRCGPCSCPPTGCRGPGLRSAGPGAVVWPGAAVVSTSELVQTRPGYELVAQPHAAACRP
jgi:hypothetical protein